MMKRGWFICFLGLFAAAAYAQTLAKPTADITQFQIKEISLRDVTFQFELTVSNPYPLELSFSGMTLDFFVDGSIRSSTGRFPSPCLKYQASLPALVLIINLKRKSQLLSRL